MLETLRNVGITPFLQTVVLQQVEGRAELRVDAFLAPLREGSQVCYFSMERHMERYSLT